MAAWRRTIDIKRGLRGAEDDDEDTSVSRFKAFVVPLFREEAELTHRPGILEFTDSLGLLEFADRFEECETQWDMNDVLDDVYDWSDARKIWLGI